MLKELAEYIVNNAAPVVQEIAGHVYTDKPLTRVDRIPNPEPLYFSTLTSLVDFISFVDVNQYDPFIVHVESPTRVSLISALDEFNNRQKLAVAEANIPRFDFNRWIDHEAFCIGVQSKFINVADRPHLLRFAGTVENGTVATYGDDGVTQKATIKTGIASKADAIVPNPVTLVTYRTFLEVDQPETQYIFRMKESCGAVQCALFEADGGAWEREATCRIHAYLEKSLEEYPYITIIS